VDTTTTLSTYNLFIKDSGAAMVTDLVSKILEAIVTSQG
jgi:hypothetical protein